MKRILVCLICVFIFASPISAIAEVKTFIKEYTYQASEIDSKVSCRAIALAQVKRLLLEELGTYLESYSEVRNYQLTHDQITTLTAGIVQAKIIGEQWNGEIYRLKAKITADPDSVVKTINDLRKDKMMSRELEQLRQKYKDTLIEIERLKKEAGVSQNKDEKFSEYKATIDELNASDWYEKGLRYCNSKEREKAIEAFSSAIEIKPNLLKAYSLRGMLYNLTGQHNKSIDDLSKAIELNPNYYFVYVSRGLTYASLKMFGRSIDDLNKAIELNPYHANSYKARATVYLLAGNKKLAIPDFRKACDLGEKSACTWLEKNTRKRMKFFPGCLSPFR